MKTTTKACIVFSLVFLFFLPIALSQGVGAGLGINNYHLIMGAGLGDVVTQGLGVFNPSPYEETVKIYIECDNCVSDVKIFGFKVADNIEDIYQFVSLSAKELTVPPNSDARSGPTVWVTLNPKLLFVNHLKFYTPEEINFYIRLIDKGYGGSFEVPYPALLVGEKDFNGRVSIDVVSSSFGYLGVAPSVASTLEVKARGMPFGSFVLLLAAVTILVFLAARRYGLAERLLAVLKRKKGKPATVAKANAKAETETEIETETAERAYESVPEEMPRKKRAAKRRAAKKKTGTAKRKSARRPLKKIKKR